MTMGMAMTAMKKKMKKADHYTPSPTSLKQKNKIVTSASKMASLRIEQRDVTSLADF